jgi:hypothetical protein
MRLGVSYTELPDLSLLLPRRENPENNTLHGKIKNEPILQTRVYKIGF